MRVVVRIASYYFVIALPVIIASWLLWPACVRGEFAAGSALLAWGNAAMGAVFAAWMISAVVVAVAVVASPSYRERLLTRMTRMKERDEREERIVGAAARNAFLFNLALLIFLFLLNLLTVDVTKLPPGQAIRGKEHTLSLGLNLTPFVGAPEPAAAPVPEGATSLFRYRFPLTASGVAVVLILANLGAFAWYAMREGRG